AVRRRINAATAPGCLFCPAPGSQAMKLGLEIAGLLAGGGRSALDEGGLEPRRSPAFARAGFCASGWTAACRGPSAHGEAFLAAVSSRRRVGRPAGGQLAMTGPP